MIYLPTSVMSFKDKVASFFGVVIPLALSFGIIYSNPKPLSQVSIYLIWNYSDALKWMRSANLSIKQRLFAENQKPIITFQISGLNT